MVTKRAQKRVGIFLLVFSLLVGFFAINFVIANVTSIWTRDNGCGPDVNVNSYEIGESVSINGAGTVTGTEAWTITGTPGSADPNTVVASGTIGSAGNGFCINNAYTVQPGDDGVYKVNVEGKNDNYQVVLNAEEPIECTDNDEDGYFAEGGDCGVVDCNDNNANINPGEEEICNQIDDNCNQEIDEGNICVEEENEAPTCSVDFLRHKFSFNEYPLSPDSTVYLTETGNFFIFGDSLDDQGIFNVQYNRTSPDTYYLYTDTDPTDGGFSELQEGWKTDPNDEVFVEGEHRVCCRVEDNNHVVTEPGECVNFCIDTQNPLKVENIEHSNPSACVPNYVSNAPEWEWDEAEDNGCSEVAYYEVGLYYSNGSLIDTIETEDNSFFIEDPTNGEDYYIRVRAIDNAGNEGPWSGSNVPEENEHVYYDNENPTVEITGMPWDVWYNDDFNVIEEDADNLGLYLCEYRINNDDEWTSTPCNELINMDISEICPEDGENSCVVEKRVTDNACNDATTEQAWDLDRENPITTKTVSQPKVLPWGSWIGILINGFFVTDQTEIVLSCDDNELSGCANTYYRIKYNEQDWSGWLLYDEPFSLGEEDGLYYIEYYSIDNAGNQEETLYEVDKVDTLSPVTTKTIGTPQYFDEETEKLWVTSNTTFTMSCADSEVGCDFTKFNINEGNEITYNYPFNLDGEDGLYTIEYYSEDLLGNQEEVQVEYDWLDNTPPVILVHNPTLQETEIERCVQAIVVSVYDSGSGLNEATVKAKLYNSSQALVREINLTKSIYGTYEGLMNKELPAGEYTLVIEAEDNLGNKQTYEIEETLLETVFVEYVSPASCTVNPETGGSCDFTFNVCMRGDNSVQFWMNKLGDVITPAMLEAEISNGEEDAFVGLKHDGFESPAEVLQLGQDCTDINGRTSFDLHLDMDSEDVNQIGPGLHDLEYWIESSLQPESCLS